VSVLIITFAHKNTSGDYTPFYDALKSSADRWWHYIDSTWIVETSLSADSYAKLLIPHIFSTDQLLVAKLNGQYQGWLPEDAWKWLNQRIY